MKVSSILDHPILHGRCSFSDEAPSAAPACYRSYYSGSRTFLAHHRFRLSLIKHL